jgi:hypothetical protein
VAPDRGPRLHYLDDLKVALTALVVVHHCAGAVNGRGNLGLGVGAFANAGQVLASSFLVLQQGYFMVMFFFVAAFFAPSSLLRKGPAAFIADRAQRLGVPFVAYVLALGPVLNVISSVVAGNPLSYTPSANVSWFLVILLFFSGAFAAIDPATWAPPMARPSLAVLVACGAGLGAAQAVQMLFVPVFPLIPVTFGSLPFDAAAFWAGTAAARGCWLAEPFPALEVAAARAVVVAAAVGIIALHAYIYTAGGGLLLAANACNATQQDWGFDRFGGDGGAVLLMFLLSVALGVFCVCMHVAAIDLFQRVAAAPPGPWRRWAAEVAYAAYLLHPFVVMPLTVALVAAARSSGAAMAVWSPDNNSGACFGSPGDAYWLAVGFFAITAFSLALVYPLATLLKRIPGASRIL